MPPSAKTIHSSPITRQCQVNKAMSASKALLLITLPTLIVCVIAGELFFRFVIPSAQTPWGYYDPTERIARFEQGQGSGLYTQGKFATEQGRWRINNMGWNSDIDYAPDIERHKPLIAVLGDSYVEAFQVDITASFVSLLRSKVKSTYDVYGFGKSGAPLSQYLQMSRYVRQHFKPDVFVVNVVHNDFNESLTSVMSLPYYLGLSVHDGEVRESPLADTPITIKPTSRMLFSSAIFRYLWLNLHLGESLIEWGVLRNEMRAPTATANRAPPDPAHVREEQAADYVIRKFKEENPHTELVFMIDGSRRDIYARRVDDHSDVLWMNSLLRRLCEEHQCRFIDLTEPFRTKFNRDGVMLSGETDYHWNKEGHRVVADVLYERLLAFGITS
jgi:hypothetical protein